MLKYFILFVLFRVCLSASVGDFESPIVVEINEENNSGGAGGAVINGTFYQTVKNYYCRSASTTNQELLVYGSRAWTFPLQDVNLTLQYPSNNAYTEPGPEYTITELRVMLLMDGSESRGHITRGGLLQNNISITFVAGNVSRLSYHFWLYGVVQQPQTATDNYNGILHKIC